MDKDDALRNGHDAVQPNEDLESILFVVTIDEELLHIIQGKLVGLKTDLIRGAADELLSKAHHSVVPCSRKEHDL